MNELQILGPPGTGKTHALSEEFLKAVEKYGEDKVLVSSFTRAAAREIANRLDSENVATLHAHCYHALDRPKLATGKNLDTWNKEHPAYAIGDGKATLDEPETEHYYASEGDRLMSHTLKLRAMMTPEEKWPWDAQKFYKAFRDWKKANDLVDFSDLIENALIICPIAPHMPNVGIHDEAQDYTNLELSLIRKWGSHMDYHICAGDDDQAIYTWKGVDVRAFIQGGTESTVLSQSYRVPKRICDFSQNWIKKLSFRAEKPYQPREEVGEIKRIDATTSFPDDALALAEKEVKQGGTVMILVSCGFFLNSLIAKMKSSGVPFWNPHRRTRGDWNPLANGSEKRTTAKDRLVAFLKPSWKERWSARDVKAWAYILKSKEVLTLGAKESISELKGDEPMTEQWINRKLFPEKMYEMYGCLDHSPSEAATWYWNNVIPSKRTSYEYLKNVVRRCDVKALQENPKISVGTIHSVKGGEADVVILFPDVSNAGMMQWCGSPIERDCIIRQFYVGMTRAKRKLIICNPSSNNYINF